MLIDKWIERKLSIEKSDIYVSPVQWASNSAACLAWLYSSSTDLNATWSPTASALTRACMALNIWCVCVFRKNLIDRIIVSDNKDKLSGTLCRFCMTKLDSSLDPPWLVSIWHWTLYCTEVIIISSLLYVRNLNPGKVWHWENLNHSPEYL